MSDRLQRGLETLRNVVGAPSLGTLEHLKEIAPDFGHYLAESFGELYARPGLDTRAREVATIAALTALGTAPRQLKVHIQAGLNVGLTETEITEILMQMSAYAGFPAALNGLAVAQEAFREFRAPGLGGASYTWLGFGAVLIRTPGGRTIAIDPWLQANPLCPKAFKQLDSCDLILVTHGHRDHASEVAEVAQRTGATVIASWDLAQVLAKRGVTNLLAINKGGTRQVEGLAITAVHADHSSGFVTEDQLLYAGEPMGYVVRMENGYTFYHAGDTAVFGDMALIGELYRPDLAMLPIGDAYTMSPREAARAVRLLGAKHVIPTHWGWDFLKGTPEELVALTVDIPNLVIHNVKPGQAIQEAQGQAPE